MSDQPEGALAGVRVLDIATFIAAPFSAAILGEFGAEVIKIETPAGGDSFRKFGTPTERDDSSLMWLSEARNKRSMTLDLRTAAGADILKRLVQQSDVVCENFRPGTLEKWGLGWDVLSAINPGLVMLRISGYGQTGPYRDRPGFARIAHAFGGLTALAGHEGEAPVTPGSTSLADYMSGLYGAIGILIALREREVSGLGQVVDIALYESIFRALDEVAPAYARNGIIRGPEGSGTRNACPHGHFPSNDEAWVAIACTTDKMFQRLATAMGKPDLAAESRYGSLRPRLENRETVDRLVAAWTGSMSREEIMSQCLAFGAPCAPVNRIDDLFRDPQIEARDNLITMTHPELGDITVPGVVPKLSRTAGAIRHLGPALGDATEDILTRLCGLNPEDIAKLRDDDII